MERIDEFLSKPRLLNDMAEEEDMVERARKLSVKILLGLTGKLHVSGVLAALSILDMPDHYSSHAFVSLYLNQYVRVVKDD